jgi:hypothetical protein
LSTTPQQRATGTATYVIKASKGSKNSFQLPFYAAKASAPGLLIADSNSYLFVNDEQIDLQEPVDFRNMYYGKEGTKDETGGIPYGQFYNKYKTVLTN